MLVLFNIALWALLIGGIAWLVLARGLDAWLRLKRLGLPFSLKNVMLLPSLEAARRDEEADAALEVGSAAWARDVAGPDFLAEIRRRVDEGWSWETATTEVLSRDRPEDRARDVA